MAVFEVLVLNGKRGEEREREERGEGKERVADGKGGEGSHSNWGLDPAVEEGREGRRARRGAWVGASRHFFHFKHRS